MMSWVDKVTQSFFWNPVSAKLFDFLNCAAGHAGFKVIWGRPQKRWRYMIYLLQEYWVLQVWLYIILHRP